MEGKKAGVLFLRLIILTAVNVNSQFHQCKGLSVYDIELWYRTRGTGNNSGTYHSSNLGDSGDGKKSEESLRKYCGEESVIDCDETGDSPGESNLRFFYPWEDMFCDYLIDCDESDESDQSYESTPKPTSFPPTLDTQPPPPQPHPGPTGPQPTPTLDPYSTPTPSLPISDSENPGPIPESITPSINGITIPSGGIKLGEIPSSYYRRWHSPNAYKFHSEQVCWFDARSLCQMESGELLVIENGAQYDIVLGIAKEIIGDAFARFHIGFQRQLATAFPWITVYGDRLPFEKWATCTENNTIDHPNNCGGFIIGPDHLNGLTSNPCSQKYSYICEFKPPSCCG